MAIIQPKAQCSGEKHRNELFKTHFLLVHMNNGKIDSLTAPAKMDHGIGPSQT